MDLLIHGVYDALTLETLRQLQIKRIGFDLRGKSPNLIPFHTLIEVVKNLNQEKLYLIFENDLEATVLSFLSLLKNSNREFTLEFRGQESAEYLFRINHPFIWFFDQGADWKKFFAIPHLKGIVLPFETKLTYQNADFWESIERRNLDIYIHVNSLSKVQNFISEEHLILSVDLTGEVESSFRKIDQERLMVLRRVEQRI